MLGGVSAAPLVKPAEAFEAGVGGAGQCGCGYDQDGHVEGVGG